MPHFESAKIKKFCFGTLPPSLYHEPFWDFDIKPSDFSLDLIRAFLTKLAFFFCTVQINIFPGLTKCYHHTKKSALASVSSEFMY